MHACRLAANRLGSILIVLSAPVAGVLDRRRARALRSSSAASCASVAVVRKPTTLAFVMTDPILTTQQPVALRHYAPLHHSLTTRDLLSAPPPTLQAVSTDRCRRLPYSMLFVGLPIPPLILYIYMNLFRMLKRTNRYTVL